MTLRSDVGSGSLESLGCRKIHLSWQQTLAEKKRATSWSLGDVASNQSWWAGRGRSNPTTAL
ncbi:MAG: hypothetical protein ACF788_08790 [Novipirellula sp. JB048]